MRHLSIGMEWNGPVLSWGGGWRGVGLEGWRKGWRGGVEGGVDRRGWSRGGGGGVELREGVEVEDRTVTVRCDIGGK